LDEVTGTQCPRRFVQGRIVQGLFMTPITVLQVAKAERRDRVDFIAKYFKESTKTHGGYAINFFLCEVNNNKNKKINKI
jgi:hypothetical protein